MYATNSKAENPKLKLIKMKGEIYKSMITGGDFNMPISRVDGITKQKIS